MPNENLNAYLNDHLAGSVAAMEMIEHWSAAETDPSVRMFLDALLTDIQADQQTLRQVLQSAGGCESTLKKSSAWISEKLGRLKMAVTGSSPQAWGFYRLEQFDLLVAGVCGKQALWDALAAACAGDERLARFNWQELARRAREQIDRIERHRLTAARLAFA